MDKVSVRRLPLVVPPIQEGGGRIMTDSGELTQIVNGEVFRFLAYLEFKPDAVTPRGNHYHANKVEHLYVIRGRLRGVYRDLDTGETAELEFTEGDLVSVNTRCAHVYFALEHSQAVELSAETYDPTDVIPYRL
jgi:dTDP-4-dehydrorhamnose 3,5-epimerase-like enzyme